MSGSREASVQWQPRWIDALCGHLAAGLSATMAAAEVNTEFGTKFTRSAIIGKAKREGIPLRASKGGGRRGPHGGPSQRKPRVRASTKKLRPAAPEPSPKLPAAPAELRCDPIAPGTLHLLELQEGMCRYPTGDSPESIRFCGRWQLEGAYCAAHSRLCLRTPEPRTRPSYR